MRFCFAYSCRSVLLDASREATLGFIGVWCKELRLSRFFSVFAILPFLLFAFAIEAQTYLDARLSKSEAMTGDSLVLRLTAKLPEGAMLVEPHLSLPPGFSAFELLRSTSWDTLERQGGFLMLQRDFVLIAWDSVQLQIPPVVLAYRLPQDTTVQVLQSRPLALKIGFPPLEEGEELKPIRSIEREPSYWSDVLKPWMLIPLLLVLWLLVRWWRRYSDRQLSELVQQEPPLPPHEQALKQLELLEQNAWWKQGRVKEFHTALSHLLRAYLEVRFGIQALEQTTPEIIAQLRQSRVPAAWTDSLKELLSIADLVKFAKAQPPEDFHQKALDKVRAFVLETAERETENRDEREIGDG